MQLICRLWRRSRWAEILLRTLRMKRSCEFIRIISASLRTSRPIRNMQRSDDWLLSFIIILSLFFSQYRAINQRYTFLASQMDKSSFMDSFSEPDKQASFSFHSHASRERQKFEALSFQLEEAKRQIRKLNQTIKKMSENQAKCLMVFQAKIGDLESEIRQLKTKLDFYENDRLKNNRMVQSKLNRSQINQSIRAPSGKFNADNKQNLNTLNMQEQLKCSSPFCEAKQQLQNLRSLAIKNINIVNSILYSLEIRQKSLFSNDVFDEWIKKMQGERNERKSDESKSSIQLVRVMQLRLNQIHDCIQKRQQKNHVISEPLFQTLKSLKAKQESLMEIPLLEKVDIEITKEEVVQLLGDAFDMKERILALIKRQND